MTFLAPGWLALLAAVAALVAAYVVAQRRRGRYAVRFATLPLLERVVGRGPGLAPARPRRGVRCWPRSASCWAWRARCCRSRCRASGPP